MSGRWSYALFALILLTGACGSPPAAEPPVDPSVLPGRYLTGDPDRPVDLLPDGTAYTWQDGGFVFRDTYVATGDTVTFTGESCDRAEGTYRWTWGEAALRLESVNDPCAARVSALTGPLARAEDDLAFTTVRPSMFLDQPGFNFAAVDAAGAVYTTDGHSGFYKYQPDGNVIARWPDALTFTVGITVDSRGTIYVANFDDATIHKYDSAGTPLTHWSVDQGRIGPVGITHDAEDNILVALHRIHDHYVEKYTPDGRLMATWAGPGTADGQVTGGPADGPSEIAVDRDGNSYLTDPLNDRVVSFGPDGTFRHNLTGGEGQPLHRPGTVAVDSEGNVYTDSGLTIWKFSRTGALLGRWFTPMPGPLVVDAQDRVLQVDGEIRVLGFPNA